MSGGVGSASLTLAKVLKRLRWKRVLFIVGVFVVGSWWGQAGKGSAAAGVERDRVVRGCEGGVVWSS